MDVDRTIKNGMQMSHYTMLRIHMQLYVYTYLSKKEYEINLIVFRFKRMLARLQNLDCKRLDIFSQTNTPFLIFL